MSDNQSKTKDRSHYFDWFIKAGLLMNVAVVLYLVGFWLLH
jgi:hypothetical protein